MKSAGLTMTGLPAGSLPDEERLAIDAIRKALLARARTTRLRHGNFPSVLWHYTDAAGLLGIVRKGHLRATHLAFMNDAKEYMHANEMLLKEVQTASPQDPTEPLQHKLLEDMEATLKLTKPENAWPYFVACFSAKQNSLNQWRAYGRGEGGFSIGFDANELERTVIPNNTYLSPALYDLREQQLLVQELLRWSLQEYPERAQQHRHEEQTHRQLWIDELLKHASMAAPILKNSDFAEEEEWRLIHPPPNDASDVDYLPKPTGLFPYVRLKFRPGDDSDRLPIRSLWSGPGRLANESGKAAEYLLRSKGYSTVEFHCSEIPYRVG
jgi:hypothetical protein